MKLLGTLSAALVATAAVAVAQPRVVPGLQADGSTLLHNQWPIRPAGTQLPLGDFPVNLALHPSGRYAAILHAGYGPHQVWVVDLRTNAVVSVTTIPNTYAGIAFSTDGRELYCSGGGEGTLHRFAFQGGALTKRSDWKIFGQNHHAVVADIAVAPDNRNAFVSVLFASHVLRLNLRDRTIVWNHALDPVSREEQAMGRGPDSDIAPNDDPVPSHLIDESEPFGILYDARHHRVYAALWGRSAVAVLDADSGRELARWNVGLHPNDLALSRDAARLFVSIGGRNEIAVVDTATGAVAEKLSSAYAADDLPGSTPDSVTLSPDGKTLFAANARNNNVAVFDISEPGKGRPLGFIPTGWYPSTVRLTLDGRRLLVLSARGIETHANGKDDGHHAERFPKLKTNDVTYRPGAHHAFPYIGSLYEGTLGLLDFPAAGAARDRALAEWTASASQCRPATPAPAAPDSPIPAAHGSPSPIKYVVYIIKENRTYDEVFGDLAKGNGDPSLCLFPEATTPNLHKLVNQFVLLDNLYANSEVSASGHEWTMAGFCSEFVERNWPPNYGHKGDNVPYTAEGGYLPSVPANGYLWDRALAAGISFRDYGEFVHGEGTPKSPAFANLPALKGRFDPLYHPWNLRYSDIDRVRYYLAQLKLAEQQGELPRLQILRIPNDHTQGAKAGALSPRAMVAQNDRAVGLVVEALSHSRFWPQMAIFIIEDDAQNGPDHVDAHRTEGLVISPYTRHGAVDSTAYTTCSMLATMEAILGLEPMSQYDALAAPMRASFQATPDLTPYDALEPRVSLTETNPAHTKAAAISARFNFAKEDAIDDQQFNRVLWMAMRGEESVMPAPVHAAFVRSIKTDDDD